jgi:hypothetical protein
MPNGHTATLADRSVLAIAGAEARSFLQGLITNDVEKVSPSRAVYAALLTPQGKILFDFFVAAHGERYLLDCAASRKAELHKRLMFYRLRAAVTIEDASDGFDVAVAWGDAANFGLGIEPGAGLEIAGGIAYVDPRTAAMGVRAIVPGGAARLAEAWGLAAADAGAYHRHRIALGLADSDADIGSGELFPHETNLDQLNGVDFKKGCYVGQEVVSRTEHRSSARKRIVPVTFEGDAPPSGTSVDAQGKSVGTVLSGSGPQAVALVRLDRLESARAAGAGLAAGGHVLHLRQPPWARFDVPGAEGPS